MVLNWAVFFDVGMADGGWDTKIHISTTCTTTSASRSIGAFFSFFLPQPHFTLTNSPVCLKPSIILTIDDGSPAHNPLDILQSIEIGTRLDFVNLAT